MTESQHVFLMSTDSKGSRDEYWFGTNASLVGVSGVLADLDLPPSEAAVEGFLADPNAPKTDIAQVDGKVYYLARHPHHREQS